MVKALKTVRISSSGLMISRTSTLRNAGMILRPAAMAATVRAGTKPNMSSWKSPGLDAASAACRVQQAWRNVVRGLDVAQAVLFVQDGGRRALPGGWR